LFGFLNVSVALWTIYLFQDKLHHLAYLKTSAIASMLILVMGFIYSENILSFSENQSYPDDVIFSKTSTYQRLILTKNEDDLRFYLNGNLQFSSRDEYRYHEALVHVGLASIPNPKNVLVLGGGDGLAVREILKYPSVTKITLVDLDPTVTQLFKTNKILTKINDNALNSEKVVIVNQDAYIWLKNNNFKYDYIIVDLPDPSNFSLGKLYTNTFYHQLKRSLQPEGYLVVQSTSPYVAKKSFWIVNSTIQSVGFNTFPYHVYVPAFGDWGYILAGLKSFQVAETYPDNLKFINRNVVSSLMVFPEDIISNNSPVNKLNNQILVRVFEEEWSGHVSR
jgi:spermidine synthase